MKLISKSLLLVCTALILSTGCAGYHTATLNPDAPDGIHYSQLNASILGIGTSATELADAKLISAQANLLNAQAENIRTGVSNDRTAKTPGQYKGIVFNRNLNRTLHVNHPNMSKVVDIAPGQYKPLFTDEIPSNLYAWYDSERDRNQYAIPAHKTKKTYDGVTFDWAAAMQ